MRVRQKLVIDRHSGDASLATEAADDSADFATRVRELRESLPDLADVQARYAAAVCDGCGDRAELDFENPELPPGWGRVRRRGLLPSVPVPELDFPQSSR